MTVYQWLCVGGIPSVVFLLLSWAINKKLKRADEKADETRQAAEDARRRSDAIAAGMQALLRDRLLQGYRFCQEKGFADFEERENLENVYEQYHALGGNGSMTDMRRAFRALPNHAGGQPTPVID